MMEPLTGVEQNLLEVTGTLPRLLFVLAGPSGVGKNTIIKKLLTNHPRMDRVRTYTTRPRRAEEVEGEQYHFVTPEQFEALAVKGRLMEAGPTQLGGHDVYGLGKSYSMPADAFEEIDPVKHLVIAEVDVPGTRRLRQRYPDCVTVFVTAPPLDLLQRIRERPDTYMDGDALAHRMQTAREQIGAAREFDYVVINFDDRLDETLQAIETIIAAERNRVRPGFDLAANVPEDAFSLGGG